MDSFIFEVCVFALYATLGAAPRMLVFFKKLTLKFFLIICFSLLALPHIYSFFAQYPDGVAQAYVLLVASVHIFTSMIFLLFMGLYICRVRKDVQSRAQICRLWLWSEFYSFLFPVLLIAYVELPEILSKVL